MDSALPFNLDITNPDGNSFVTWILVTNDGRTQLDGRPHGDALVICLPTLVDVGIGSFVGVT